MVVSFYFLFIVKLLKIIDDVSSNSRLKLPEFTSINVPNLKNKAEKVSEFVLTNRTKSTTIINKTTRNGLLCESYISNINLNANGVEKSRSKFNILNFDNNSKNIQI